MTTTATIPQEVSVQFACGCVSISRYPAEFEMHWCPRHDRTHGVLKGQARVS
jgi:hypothetical protein